MKIKINNATEKMIAPEISEEPIKFNSKSIADVSDKVGKKLIEAHDDIEKVKEVRKKSKKDKVS